MSGDSTKSHPSGIIPLKVKEVTATVIASLKTIPFARANEGYGVSQHIFPNKFIPQADDKIFLKLYVTHDLIKNGKLDITSTDLFPNYIGRVFEVEQNGVKQLVMVGLSNELDLDLSRDKGLPFLIYIPPSPQDTPAAHKTLFPNLYTKSLLKDIPIFYKDDSTYPYSWDWLFFQFFSNMYKLSYQLKKAERPYVYIVPLVKSFSDGLGFLNSGTIMEQCLLGIQKFYLDEQFKENGYILGDLEYVTFASFSIGNSILSNIINQNRQNPFFRNKVKDFYILDPPFGNPKNRSPIINTIVSTMQADSSKSIFLYTQDAYYIQPLIQNFLTPKKISFDLRNQKIFSDPQVKGVFFAYLEPSLFLSHIQDPLLKNVHNTFPNLFIQHAATRSRLRFLEFNGKKFSGRKIAGY